MSRALVTTLFTALLATSAHAAECTGTKEARAFCSVARFQNDTACAGLGSGHVLYNVCKATAGDDGPCSRIRGPSERRMCKALARRDAAKCGDIKKNDELKAMCQGLASYSPSLCRKAGEFQSTCESIAKGLRQGADLGSADRAAQAAMIEGAKSRAGFRDEPDEIVANSALLAQKLVPDDYPEATKAWVKAQSPRSLFAEHPALLERLAFNDYAEENYEFVSALATHQHEGQSITPDQVYETFVATSSPREINVGSSLRAAARDIYEDGDADLSWSDFESLETAVFKVLGDVVGRGRRAPNGAAGPMYAYHAFGLLPPKTR